MTKTFECVECPFYTTHQYWNGYALDDEEWCMFHDEMTGICGNCTREVTTLDEDAEEEDFDA